MMARVLLLAVCLGLTLAPAYAEAPPASDAAARLDTALREAAASYTEVKDYKALFVKQEADEKGMGETEEIFLKFEKPFKIFMKWLNTHKKGLQVLYERGRHDGKLVIHKPGLLLGLAPVVYLNQDSPWVREGSASYNIEDAGIGTFLNDFTRAVAQGARENKLKVEWPQERLADVSFPGTQKDSVYFAQRIRALFDAKTGLPVRMELFDGAGQPMGVYEYRDLVVNGGDDAEFLKQINRHLLKVYSQALDKGGVKGSNFARSAKGAS